MSETAPLTLKFRRGMFEFVFWNICQCVQIKTKGRCGAALCGLPHLSGMSVVWLVWQHFEALGDSVVSAVSHFLHGSKSISELRWTILTKSVFLFSPLAAFHTSASSTCLPTSSPYLPAQVIGWIPVSDRPTLQQLMVGRTPSDGISVQGEVEKGGMGSAVPQ